MRSVVIAALVIASSAAAQFPIGHATPIGGFSPSLYSEPTWLGNSGFGWRIVGAPPGGAAFLMVSASRQDQLVGGLQVYIDPNAALLTQSGFLDGTGTAVFPFPLGGPESPALAGLHAYAQAAVSAPGSPGLGTTEGLLLEIALHPMLAFSADSQTLSLVDLVAGTVVGVPGLPSATVIRAMTFGNGGRDLFVATDGGVSVVDTLAPAPAAVLLAPGACTSIAWDHVHLRLYALRATNSLTVFQGDRGSPLFGSVITTVTSNLHTVALSADGTVLALLAQYSGAVQRRTADPASPSYLSAFWNSSAPVVTGNGFWAGAVDISPDGRVVTVPEHQQFPPSTALHRFDAVLGVWIDHASGVSGYQPLSNAAYGAVPDEFQEPIRSLDGRLMYLVGGYDISRVDLSLAAPATVTAGFTPLLPLPYPSGYVATDPTGRFLLRRDYPTGSPPAPHPISLVDVATGAVTPLGTVPFLGNYSATVAAWR